MVWTDEYNATYGNSLNLVPIKGQKHNYFIHELVMRLNRGEAPVVIFVGDMGNGKSEKALRLVEILQEELDLFQGSFTQDQLIYDPLEFMEKLLEMEEEFKESYNVDQDIFEGRKAFLLDEAGVNLNVADYHSDMNKSVDEILQTMRVLNSLYIFIVPELIQIDSRIRTKADIIVHVEEQGMATPVLVEKDNKSTKRTDAFRTVPLYNHRWYPDRASEDNRKIYEDKEIPFKFGQLEEKYELMKKKREEEEKKKEKESASLEL